MIPDPDKPFREASPLTHLIMSQDPTWQNRGRPYIMRGGGMFPMLDEPRAESRMSRRLRRARAYLVAWRRMWRKDR